MLGSLQFVELSLELIGIRAQSGTPTPSSHHQRPALADARGRLEGAGKLEHAQLALVAPDDLQAHGQAL
jgi:hypothetical protein